MLIIWIDPRVNDQGLGWVVAKFDDDDDVYLIDSYARVTLHQAYFESRGHIKSSLIFCTACAGLTSAG